MVQLVILSVVAFVGFAAGIPIPNPTSYAHYNYVQPGPGSFHYTVIHPPHPDHKYYHAVPLAYTKPLYIFNPFQHHILLVDNNLQVQAPPAVAAADAKVPEPKQELALPEVDAAADAVEAPKNVDADDDAVAVEAEDAKPEGREEPQDDAVKSGDEEDLEGGAKAPSTEDAGNETQAQDNEAPVAEQPNPEKIEPEAPEADSAAKSGTETDDDVAADYAVADDDTE